MIQNYYSENPEWQYLFKNAMDWDTILPLYYPSYPTPEGFKNKEEVLQYFEDLLNASGDWLAKKVYPRARELDVVGGGKVVDGKVVISDVLKQTYKEATELGVFGATLDTRYGGMGLPTSVGLMMFEQTARACVATSTQLCFFASIADMIDRFCTKEDSARLIPKIVAGELSGSMCLTEPGAGSDVGSLRTRAEKLPDGKYKVNGTKIFITNGGGGVGMVLARIKGAPEGLAGISMFLIEEWVGDKHNYRIAKIEDKMGMHGSPTCEIVYEDSIATLIGEENQGFQLMLHLMNEARISVGAQGLGNIESAIENIREYAEVRKQFGKTLLELPLFKRNYDDFCTERDAIRALIADTISNYDIFQRLDLKKRHTGELTEKETELFNKAFKITRRRTPLVKLYGTEASTAITTKAIQAFGGYGFMNEYDVGRLHRDSFGPLLYEGTSQIQSLMALKDLVKAMMKNPGKFLQSMVRSHPIGSWVSDLNPYRKDFKGHQYECRKNIGSLMLRCFKPELGLSEALMQINKFFDREYWQDAEKIEKLMVHAETLAMALSYLETLSVLSLQAEKDPARGDLYNRYIKLVYPRLQAIYADWKQ